MTSAPNTGRAAAQASYVLLTDAPPLQKGGYGCNILSYNLLQDANPLFGLVVTRRLDRRTRRADIYQAPGVPTFVFPDAPWLRPRRLIAFAELLLFLLSLPWLARAVRRSGCQRIFALFGANPWFLPKADWLRWATGLPLEIYLVDDLEEACLAGGSLWQARLTRRFEPGVLRRAARVFVISPGYAEHLAEKYGQAAQWLPVPVRGEELQYAPYRPGTPDQRAIVFVGSVNFLYLDTLCRLYQEIVRWNESPGRPYELRLRVLSRFTPQALLDRLVSRDFLDLVPDLDDASLHRELRAAWAVFLPYSFDPAFRFAVSTSFSHKFTEAITAGRPILVCGPAYASIPRYFREAGLPLWAESPEELSAVLGQIDAHDQPGLVERYRELVDRYHRADALRRLLESSP